MDQKKALLVAALTFAVIAIVGAFNQKQQNCQNGVCTPVKEEK